MLELGQEFSDFLGPVLQVTIHGEDNIAACCFKSGGVGSCLSVVTLEPDYPEARMIFRETFEYGKCTVSAPVVYKDNLIISAQALKNIFQPKKEFLNRVLFVVYWDDS